MRSPVAVHKAHLELLYTGTFYVALFAAATSAFAITINLANPTKLLAANHNFINNCRVRLSASAGGTLPGGFTANTDYYVVEAGSSDFSLSATKNGTPIAATSTGAGVITATEQDLNPEIDSDLNIWTRYEVDYRGSGRQSVSFGSAKTGIINNINMAYTDPVPVVFQPTSASISCRYVAILRNSSASAQDSSGLLDLVEDYVSSFTIAQNTPKGFAFVLRKYSI